MSYPTSVTTFLSLRKLRNIETWCSIHSLFEVVGSKWCCITYHDSGKETARCYASYIYLLMNILLHLIQKGYSKNVSLFLHYYQLSRNFYYLPLQHFKTHVICNCKTESRITSHILFISLHYLAQVSIDYSSPMLSLATFFNELCPVIS